MGSDIAAKCKHRSQVYLQHSVPIVVWELVGWMALLNTTAVEQDVDSVAVGEDLRRELRHRVVRREVCGVNCCFATEVLDGMFCLLV